jgi:hypothetical protein
VNFDQVRPELAHNYAASARIRTFCLKNRKKFC